MAVDASNVVVAGNGGVYFAPEGTAFPAAPTGGNLTAIASEFVNVGYISEDGVNFSMERNTEEIMAWQSMDPVRVLTTGEPKTLKFELMQFDSEAFTLAMQGGSFAGGVWTPPAAGASDVRAMIVEGKDGSYDFRFMFPRVQLQGTVEFNLQRADAIRLPLEFKVLSSTESWTVQTNHPGWQAAAGGLSAPAPAPPPDKK